MGDSNVTLYAIYKKEAKTITVTFNKNGSSSLSETSKTCTIAASYNGNAQATSCNITSPTITPASGFTALGFNTTASATSSSWSANTAKSFSSNATYYAITKSSSALTGTFNANGATISATSASCYRYNGSASCTVTTPTITRSGFTITGWGTSANATTATVKPGANATISANTTYYAVTSKEVTVTYNKGANVSAIGATSGTCTIQNSATNCQVTLPTITANSGYTSVGWSTTNGATTGTAAGSKLTVSNNATYYANAVDKTAPTVTLNPNTQASYIAGGKAVTVTIADSGSGIAASQPVYYAWSTSSTTVPSFTTSVTTTATAGSKSATVTVPATASSTLTGSYYLWIKSGVKDVSGNTSSQKVSSVFKFDNKAPTVSISTTSTTNSITVVTSASAASGISKYEYSKDGGKTWENGGTNKTYTFTNLLPANASDMLKSKVVTTGDGLYKDEYEDGRYIYKGANPNNYITFNNELWRIMSVEKDGTIKIIRKTIVKKAWDESKSNNWARPATLNTYLNGEYLSTITTNQDKIVSHNWSIGSVTHDNKDLTAQIAVENGKTWNGKVALMTASEYLRSNTNKAQCGTFQLNNDNYQICIRTNYLDNIIPSNKLLWTLSARGDSDDPNSSVWGVSSNGRFYSSTVHTTYNYFVPALYLTSDIGLKGDGSQANPYTIGNNSYPIKARATSNVGKSATSDTKDTQLKTITPPTFSESATSTGKTVTITYPSGCGSTYTCSYQKDNGSAVTVTSTTANVSFTATGSLVAKVSDGTNTVSSSYAVEVETTAKDKIEDLVNSKPDELYKDNYDNIRYYGQNPNNYVYFNCTDIDNQTSDTCELWRIMGVIDGKAKIISNEFVANYPWDFNGLNNWDNSTLKSYLNGDYYNSINSVYQAMISEETYYLGGPTDSNYRTLTASEYYTVERDSSQVYSGNSATTIQKIGLMYPSDYGYAAGQSCLTTALTSYAEGCYQTNYLFNIVSQWLQSPVANSRYAATMLAGQNSVVCYDDLSTSTTLKAVLYLTSTTKITGGDGSQSSPFTLG